MHRRHLPHTISTFVILLAVLACVLPGQTIQPAPVTNPNAISTAVAGTAHAAEQQTQQANPLPPTATIVPTDTMTPQPKVSSAGTSLLNLADGSTQFTDHLAGVQMVFPSIWVVFRIGEPEYYAAWEKHNLEVPERFATLQNADPKVLRVIALDMRPDHIPDGLITGLSIIFLADNMDSLEQWEQFKRGRPRPCAGHKFISSSYPQTTNGTRVLVLEQSCMTTDENVTIYYRDVYFSLPSGTLHLDFETNFAYKDAPLLEFDQVVNSITPLTP